MTSDSAIERRLRRVDSTVRRFMDENALWPADGRLLLAVSGGADSTALLLIMSRLAKRRDLVITVAHFDHGLRDKKATEADASLVRELSGRLRVSLVEGCGDVRSLAKAKKLSIEEAARRARYEFLAAVARDTGSSVVATGHTASDQAETVLMHILRGSGLPGLGGMEPTAAWPLGNSALTLVRPLLTLSRSETAAYCESSDITPAEDESNTSLAFLRNRMRHELLPVLREYNPRVEEALVRLGEAARGGSEIVETVAAALVKQDGDCVSLRRDALKRTPAALCAAALRHALRQIVGDLQGFSERHIRALIRLVTKGLTGDRLDLPRGVRALLTPDALELQVGLKLVNPLPEFPVTFGVPGCVRFGRLMVAAGLEAPVEAVQVVVDAEAMGDELCVRTRKAGDRFQPLGMTEIKKLQDFFTDAKVPRDERDGIVLFETAHGIAWVGGLRVAEWAKALEGRRTMTLAYWPAD